ncbi:MAG: phosphatidylglycerophosphatase A [Candidatus Methanomethylophilaceae archaeon]
MIDISAEINFHESQNHPVAVIRFNQMMEVLSSAMRNGGDTRTDTFVFVEVPKMYDHPDPQKELDTIYSELRIPSHAVGFMTAAEIKQVLTVCDNEIDGMRTKCIATAGLSNRVVAGEIIDDMPDRLRRSVEKAEERRRRMGTINIIGVSAVPLTMEAKLNSFIVATEAKTVALQSLGHEETGTTTDSLAIVCPQGEQRQMYCGTGTDLGISLARSVTTAVRNSLVKREDFPEAKSFLEHLRAFDITQQSMWDAALDLYVPNPAWETELLRDMFFESLQIYSKDVNVNSLVMAAILLERWGDHDKLYGLERGEFQRDPIHIIADEMLGMQCAQYIAGTRGLFEFHRFDRHKPGIIGRLGPFMDDIICGLVGGIMSSIYTRLFQEE